MEEATTRDPREGELRSSTNPPKTTNHELSFEELRWRGIASGKKIVEDEIPCIQRHQGHGFREIEATIEALSWNDEAESSEAASRRRSSHLGAQEWYARPQSARKPHGRDVDDIAVVERWRRHGTSRYGGFTCFLGFLLKLPATNFGYHGDTCIPKLLNAMQRQQSDGSDGSMWLESSLGERKLLEYLKLLHNSLSEAIPAQLFACTSLKVLSNALTGLELALLFRLEVPGEVLMLGEYRFSSDIPPEVELLTQLVNLASLPSGGGDKKQQQGSGGNRISGRIPSGLAMGSCRRLELLDRLTLKLPTTMDARFNKPARPSLECNAPDELDCRTNPVTHKTTSLTAVLGERRTAGSVLATDRRLTDAYKFRAGTTLKLCMTKYFTVAFSGTTNTALDDIRAGKADETE